MQQQLQQLQQPHIVHQNLAQQHELSALLHMVLILTDDINGAMDFASHASHFAVVSGHSRALCLCHSCYILESGAYFSASCVIFRSA